MDENALLELLAELEHEQWVAWSKAVAPEVADGRRQRWQSCWVPYNELPEDVKELDRAWARKVRAAISRAGLARATEEVPPMPRKTSDR